MTTTIDVDVTITGTSPLLVHRFTDAAQLSATSGTRAAVSTPADGGPAAEAAKSLYLDETGREIIPGPNMLRCLIDAGTFHKVGRSKVTTQKTSIVPAAVAVEQLVIPIHSTGGWKVDTRPVRIPATGGRILRHRPCYDDWSLSFTLQIATDMMTEAFVRELVDTAGTRIGLGDFRPSCKGPFGRFLVDHWQRQD